MTNQENDRILRQWHASVTVREYLYEILENIDIVSSGQVKVFLVGLIEKTGFRNVKNAIEDIEIQLNFDLSGKCSNKLRKEKSQILELTKRLFSEFKELYPIQEFPEKWV